MPVAPSPSETAAPVGERLVSVEVVVPSGVFWSGPARSVTVPSVSGTLGILARQSPDPSSFVPFRAPEVTRARHAMPNPGSLPTRSAPWGGTPGSAAGQCRASGITLTTAGGEAHHRG